MLLKSIYKHQKYRYASISIGKKRFLAILADTTAKRMIGLMFRKSVSKDTCMLFIFPNEARHGIWMYNMFFPIDVLWLDRELKIVDIGNALQPCKSIFDCETYHPSKSAKYVIELNSGSIKANRISRNSKVILHQASS